MIYPHDGFCFLPPSYYSSMLKTDIDVSFSFLGLNFIFTYREWGWEIFLSIERFCKTKYGYGSFPDVRDRSRDPNDGMESFFLGETLKYLYLLFDPDSSIDFSSVSLFKLSRISSMYL